MMKKRKIATILTAVALTCCCFMTSCTSLYDLAPASYAEWDGNYIYYANSRSKTTGQDDEYLIETLQYEDAEYSVYDVLDFAYKGDEVYLCLRMYITTQQAYQYDYKTCLAKYDIKDRTSQVLYWETDRMSVEGIYKMTDDYLILSTYSDYERQLIRLSYDGEILSEDDNWVAYYKEAGNYLVDYRQGKFIYTTLENEAPIEMFEFDYTFNDYQVEYYKDANNEGFCFSIISKAEESGLYFYDIVEKELHELIRYDSGVEFIRDGNYILVGKPKNVTYQNTHVTMGVLIPKAYEITCYYYGIVECRMFAFDTTGEDLALRLVYDFTTDHIRKDFSDFYVLDDGMLYFEANELIIREGGCNGKSGEEYYYYFLNPTTGELKQTKSLSYSELMDRTTSSEEETARELGAVCGGYVYYIIEERYGGWFVRYAYTLYRCEMKTGKTVVMQFWADACDFDQGEYTINTDEGDVHVRYAPKAWKYYQNLEFERAQFIVRGY